MKKILFLLITAMLILVSCRSEADKGRTMWKAYLNMRLVSPNSLQINSEKYKEDESSIVWTIDYTADSRLGTPVRDELRCTTHSDDYIIVDGEGMFKKSELKPYMK